MAESPTRTKRTSDRRRPDRRLGAGSSSPTSGGSEDGLSRGPVPARHLLRCVGWARPFHQGGDDGPGPRAAQRRPGDGARALVRGARAEEAGAGNRLDRILPGSPRSCLRPPPHGLKRCPGAGTEPPDRRRQHQDLPAGQALCRQPARRHPGHRRAGRRQPGHCRLDVRRAGAFRQRPDGDHHRDLAARHLGTDLDRAAPYVNSPAFTVPARQLRRDPIFAQNKIGCADEPGGMLAAVSGDVGSSARSRARRGAAHFDQRPRLA